MAVEIERKFLLKYLPEKNLSAPSSIIQGYIFKEKEKVVRLRIAEEHAFITVKGAGRSIERKEFEYSIPLEDAREMMRLFCKGALIEKERYRIEHSGFEWIIDKFFGTNQGLVVAEIELESADQAFDIPDWAGAEVTGDPKYYNSNLVAHPYSAWQSDP